MSQLSTLFWLRYLIFKNSLTSRGEVARKIINVIFLLVPLLLSIGIGIGLLLAIIFVEQFRDPVLSGGMTTILATLLFLMLVSQSTGASAHFDPRRFILFPIRLNQLYFLNLLSAFGEFSVFMILPSMAGVLIGLGIAYQHLWGGLLAFLLAVLWIDGIFICIGMLFSWLLSGRKRSREILFALLIGMMTVMGQLVPRILTTKFGQSLLKSFIPYRHYVSLILDWTPIGVWSFFFRRLESGELATAYTQLILVCSLWIGCTWIIGYLIFVKLATTARSSSSSTNKNVITGQQNPAKSFLSFQIPFTTGQTSAVVAKELRYFVRNPSTYLTIISSLIFPLLMFRSSLGRVERDSPSRDNSWYISAWISYVFMMNLQYFGGLFAYDAAGFRQYLLAPIKWSRLLLGKNVAIWLMVSLQISLILSGAELIDHNLTAGKIYIAICSLLVATAIYSIVGNYISIYFPYRVNFGFPAKRRENWSGVNLLIQFGLLFGVAGLLFLPIGLSWLLNSYLVRYLFFAILAILSWPLYAFLLKRQEQTLSERRFTIAETLTRKTEKI